MEEEEEKQRLKISDTDVERIAEAITVRLTEKKSFTIDAETHYNTHKELDDFLKTWKDAKSLWTRIILTTVFIGVIILIGISVYWKKPT